MIDDADLEASEVPQSSVVSVSDPVRSPDCSKAEPSRAPGVGTALLAT